MLGLHFSLVSLFVFHDRDEDALFVYHEQMRVRRDVSLDRVVALQTCKEGESGS